MSTFDLSGTIALVTGASGGIGSASCKALSDAGATVIATDMAKTASVDGASAYRQLNVTDEKAWMDLIAWVESEYKQLDILVNNAGISVTSSIANTTLETWRKCQAVNVEGLFLGTKAAAPLMAKSGESRKGGSSIVNLSSVGGLNGAALMSAYCSSKGAVKLFTQSAAVEYAALGQAIRVNSIHPGGIDTGMMHKIYQRYIEDGLFPDMETAIATVEAGHAMNRMGQADEIAGGVVYLCCPAASFVTGTQLVIDGGMTAS